MPIATGIRCPRPFGRLSHLKTSRAQPRTTRSHPLYNVAGNHDLGNEPTPEAIAAYSAHFDPDHYSFRIGPMKGMVLNSCLIQSPKAAPTHAEQQEDWLKAELEQARQEREHPVIVFQHHPWFVESIDEPDGYHNLPGEQRRRYLDLLQKYGVAHVFAGHYHANKTASHGDLEIVTTGAIGKPLRSDVSGLRIVIVRDTGIEHRFYHLGEIPNRIDLSRSDASKTPGILPALADSNCKRHHRVYPGGAMFGNYKPCVSTASTGSDFNR